MQDNQLASSEVFIALERAIYRGVRNAVEDILTTGDLPIGKEQGGYSPSLRLIPRDQAAEFLSISERTLFDLTKSGEVPSLRIGKSVRFCVADLEAYVNGLREDTE